MFDIALQAGQQIAVEDAYVTLPHGQGHVGWFAAAEMALSNYPLGFTPVRVKRVADVMLQFGQLKKGFDVGQLLD